VDLDNESRTDGNLLPVVPVVVRDGLCGWRVVTPRAAGDRPDVLGRAGCRLDYGFDHVRGER